MSAAPPISRRLAAILIADVVGYSRLMESAESATHTRLLAIRDEVTGPAIRAHDGRVVRTVGDGLLVEFPSTSAALRAAVGIQRDMRLRNVGLPTDQRIDYRIGINLGDIIVTDTDIEGDGVNLAARLEALAEPGGICVSQAVQEQVHEDLGITFVDAGEQRVKNIARPIRVYHVVLRSQSGREAARARWKRWRRDAGLRGMAAGLLVVAVAAVGAVAWWSQRAFVPPRLSMATVPFATIPSEGPDAQLASALSAELRSGLSHLGNSGLFLVLKTDRPGQDSRSVARELNVRYVLTGMLKRSADQLEVQAQLVDGESGAAAWSDQFAVGPEGMDRADRLAAARLSAALRLQLLQLEAKRAEQKPAGQRDATDFALLAYAVLYGPEYSDRAQLKQAGEWLSTALAQEPNNVFALTTRVDWLISETEYLSSADGAPLKDEARTLVKRALAAAPNNSEVWSSQATVLELSRDYGPALQAVDRSLMLDPTNVNSMLYRGRLLMLLGRADDAVRQVREAAATAPQVQDVVGSAALVECQALYVKRELVSATAACERAHGLGVGGYVTSLLLASLYLHGGDPAKARQAKDRAMREFPELRLTTFFEDRLDGPIGPRYREWAADLKQLGFKE
jgi:adenylate cyclase